LVVTKVTSGTIKFWDLEKAKSKLLFTFFATTTLNNSLKIFEQKNLKERKRAMQQSYGVLLGPFREFPNVFGYLIENQNRLEHLKFVRVY
jgi:hypothetical protein